MNPVVSVVIPTFNGEKYIKETIQSVLNQTYREFEIIISDDASEDNTLEIISLYEKDPKVRILQNKKRRGIGGNWNYGIQNSTGKYIKLVCQDDLLDPGYLKAAVRVFEENESVSLVTSYEQFVGDSDRIRNENVIPFQEMVDSKTAQEAVLRKGNWIGGPTAVMFRKKDLNVGLFDSGLKCSLDFEMWLRLLTAGNLYVMPEILFHSRIHPDQATSGCIKESGFIKENIQILYNIKLHPSLSGNMDQSELNGLLDKTILRFLRRSLRSDSIDFWKSITFVRDFTTFSNLVTLICKAIFLEKTEHQSGSHS